MDIDDVAASLGDEPRISHRALARLSGLSAGQIAQFRRAWNQIGQERRRGIARGLVELAEDNVELDFNDVFRSLLDDPDAEVRTSAVEGLWEDDHRSTGEALVRLARLDPDAAVRAAAASSLGRF